MPAPFQTVDQYISTFPPSAKKALNEIRSIIQKAAPQAEEAISYNMPAFKLDGILVWYAGYNEHIGLYPKPNVIEVFKKELTNYKLSKGTIQLPLDKPLPADLITRIVKYRIMENQTTTKVKSTKKQAAAKAKPIVKAARRQPAATTTKAAAKTRSANKKPK